jgi:hypothetical protein
MVEANPVFMAWLGVYSLADVNGLVGCQLQPVPSFWVPWWEDRHRVIFTLKFKCKIGSFNPSSLRATLKGPTKLWRHCPSMPVVKP